LLYQSLLNQLKSEFIPKSLLFFYVVSIPLIVVFVLFLSWSSSATFSEGQKDTHNIKITSPTNGQNISTHSNLTISGITTGNTTSNDGKRCYVSVVVNDIRPYQNATAVGPKGVNDYSKWYYTVLTKSTAIKEGQNKLTGKLSCLTAGISNTNSTNGNNTSNYLIKWYSLNVTGVSTPASSSINTNRTVTNSTLVGPHQPPANTTITSNGTAINPAQQTNSTTNSISQSLQKDNNTNNATSRGSLTAKLTQPPSTSKYNYNNNGNKNAKPLSISIQSSQNIVNGRGASSVTGTAYDAATGEKIQNAIVKLKITFTSNGTSKEIVGHNGEAKYSIEIKPNSKNNSNESFKATVEAFAPGYISTSKTTTSSSSTSSSSTSSVTSNSNQESIINNSG
jgi:hypothetical protein